MFGPAPLRQTLVARRGMCSDDTEHTVMVAQAYLFSDGDVNRFARDFARRMRWWLLRIPAGVGLATLRACLKLWVGFPPHRSGVHSAGNGPAMRSALLGVVANSEDDLCKLVDASSRITHTDERALQGAQIIAHAARWARKGRDEADDVQALRTRLLAIAEDEQLHGNMAAVFDGIAEGNAPAEIADTLGLTAGVSGFINHTVPMSVGCWLTYRGSGPDAFRRVVESAVELGGDSDTVAAIAGALAGAELGPEAIPSDWIDGLCEWPMTVGWMTRLSKAMAEMGSGKGYTKPPRLNGFALLLRNIVFAGIVLTHGFRRLLPPY